MQKNIRMATIVTVNSECADLFFDVELQNNSLRVMQFVSISVQGLSTKALYEALEEAHYELSDLRLTVEAERALDAYMDALMAEEWRRSEPTEEDFEHLNSINPETDWDYYSDVFKDVYGVRPKRY